MGHSYLRKSLLSGHLFFANRREPETQGLCRDVREQRPTNLAMRPVASPTGSPTFARFFEWSRKYLESPTSSLSSFTESSASDSTSNDESHAVSETLSIRSTTSTKSKCRVSFANPSKPAPIFMHPLLASTSKHRAPIYYDISRTPAASAIVDHLGEPVPLSTLLEPATEPPIRGELLLSCERFPWTITVRASTQATLPSPGCNSRPRSRTIPTSHKARSGLDSLLFKDGTRDEGEERESGVGLEECGKDDEEAYELDHPSNDIVSSLDVLCAIHTTLALPITQSEWEVLGERPAEQQQVASAYRQRCTNPGESLSSGVKRIDFLMSKTALVGVISTQRDAELQATPRDGDIGRAVVGRLVFE